VGAAGVGVGDGGGGGCRQAEPATADQAHSLDGVARLDGAAITACVRIQVTAGRWDTGDVAVYRGRADGGAESRRRLPIQGSDPGRVQVYC
jgi:hypothetical protein